MDEKVDIQEDLSRYNPEGSDMRNLQLKALEILETVDAICRKHNLTYWISGGTLLGAIRTGEFIPWDDDIDIELMLPDYKKLLKILEKELPADLYLQTPKERGYRMLFSKVRDKHSIVHSEEEDNAPYKEKGIYIDIFPEERSYKRLKDFVDFFYGRAFRRLKRGKPFDSVRYSYEYSISLFLYPLGIIFAHLARLFCRLTKPDNILHSYGIGNTTNHNANYMFPPKPILFEGKYFFAPNDPHTYLSKQYGKNYMQIPPLEKRAIHFTGIEYLKNPE